VSSLLGNLVHRSRVEDEIKDELRAIFDLLVNEKIEAGMRPEDARRAATLELGRLDIVQEQVRDARAGAFVDTFLQDLRYGARLLRWNPLFALTAALSLAIGIGANTTIFTVANALLFSAPAGVTDPGGLLDIFRGEEGKAMANFTSSYPYYLDVRRRTTTLAGTYAYEFELHAVNAATADGTQLAFAEAVTPNYFAVLGVVPAAGRLLTASADEQPDANPVVISYRYWERRFNRDLSVVGRTLDVNRHPFTIVGVAPQGFRGTNVVSPDLWLPMGMVDAVQPGTARLTNRRFDGLGMGGRLKPGVSKREATAELDTIARDLEREHPFEDRGTRLRVANLSSFPGPTATVALGLIALLLALVAVVLVIACSNLAGVLLARAVARRREIAVRIALGAGRVRLVRQLLTETSLLFLLGGTGGLFLARGMTSVLLSALPAFPIPVEVGLPLDNRVIVFTTGLSLVAALLSGLAPALQVSRVDVVSGLKDESQGPPDRMRTRHAFVIAQVAFSMMLVVVAGLLARALVRSGSIDQGFDPRGVEVASLDLSQAGYTRAMGTVFACTLVDRLRALPGAAGATLSDGVPGRSFTIQRFTVPGVPAPDGRAFFAGLVSSVESDYFATLRIPLVAGRDFTAGDRDGTQPVVIVSAAMARYFWPGQDPLGKSITWYEAPRSSAVATTMQVIGVARDLKSLGRPAEVRSMRSTGAAAGVSAPEPPPQPTDRSLAMYVSLQQQYAPRLTLLARTSNGERLASQIRDLVRSMDPNLPMVTPATLDSQSGPVYLQLRLAASVAGGVGIVGVLLAGIGIYGVTAYTTSRRTREIGIRMAMGAQRANVMSMVMRQGMLMVAIGSGVGLTLAAAAGRLFANLLFGVPPLDPLTFGSAAVLFASIGLAACYMPARRATQIDAMEALRYE
jgi:predicted permease